MNEEIEGLLSFYCEIKKQQQRRDRRVGKTSVLRNDAGSRVRVEVWRTI